MNANQTTHAAIPAPVCRMLRKATEVRIILKSRVERMEKAILGMPTADEEEREVLNMALSDCNKTKLFADFAAIGAERMERAATSGNGAEVRRNMKGVLKAYKSALMV